MGCRELRANSLPWAAADRHGVLPGIDSDNETGVADRICNMPHHRSHLPLFCFPGRPGRFLQQDATCSISSRRPPCSPRLSKHQSFVCEFRQQRIVCCQHYCNSHLLYGLKQTDCYFVVQMRQGFIKYQNSW